jgi:hypothetical protein
MSAWPMPCGGVTESTQLSLTGAQSYLATAEDALNGWYARQTAEGRTYVADGHEAIHLIDQLLGELHRVRSALIGEIRADEHERAARVDRLLARLRADHKAATATIDDTRPGVRA